MTSKALEDDLLTALASKCKLHQPGGLRLLAESQAGLPPLHRRAIGHTIQSHPKAKQAAKGFEALGVRLRGKAPVEKRLTRPRRLAKKPKINMS